MNKFRDWMEHFMEGRYGVDSFGRFLLYTAGALLLVSLFARNMIFSIIVTILLVYGYFRMMSRDTERRWEENEKYTNLKQRFLDAFRGGSRAARDRDHVYFRCPNCHQTVRVPKGKGSIQIHCPKCHTDFIRRT